MLSTRGQKLQFVKTMIKEPMEQNLLGNLILNKKKSAVKFKKKQLLSDVNLAMLRRFFVISRTKCFEG